MESAGVYPPGLHKGQPMFPKSTLIGTPGSSSLGVGVGKSVSMEGKSVKRAGEHLGMSPARYRSGGEGMLIRFAVARTDLGWVLVAAGAWIGAVELRRVLEV